MNKDRVIGAAMQIRGTLKQSVGRIAGDAKLVVDGAADKAEGKIINAVGGAKDALKDC